MSLFNCSQCGSQINSDTETCPQCGNPTKKPFLQKTIGCLGLIIIFMIIGVLFSLLHGNELTSKSPDKDISLEAVKASQEYVTRKLRTPFTAKFPIPSQARVTKIENNQYTIASYVEAKNSYGILLRKNYECIVRYEPDKDRWYQVKITVEK